MRLLVLAVLLVAQGCAPTWQGKTMQSLKAATVGINATLEAITLHCDRVLRDECIAKKVNPCEALSKCHTVEGEAHKAAIAAKSAIFVASSAVTAGQSPTTDKLVAEALQLFEALRSVLYRYGVRL